MQLVQFAAKLCFVHKFVRNLLTEWRRLELPFSGDTIVVAVSGGADSVSLLLAMHDLKKRKKLGQRMVAAHLNHGLRGAESDADEEYVRHLTTVLGVELVVGHANVSRDGNLEQNSRNARYDFLSRTAKNLQAFAVVTGHTVNDQAETFLMNLIRGSGPDGLSGMKAVRVLNAECGVWNAESEGDSANLKGQDRENKSAIRNPQSAILLVRPLLRWAKRIDTEGFCRDSSIEYRYDTMNEDTAFKRVRIRKILLPLLEDFNPKIVETLAQTAGLMTSLPKPKMDVAGYGANDCLVLKDLKLLEKRELYDVIRAWLRRHRGTTRALELKHIEGVARLILSAKSGKIAELPYGGRVIKSAGKLIYEDNKVENCRPAN